MLNMHKAMNTSFHESRKTRPLLIIVIGLICLAASPRPTGAAVFDVDEMLGEVAGTSAEVFLQLGSEVTADNCFKLGYDTVSHDSDHAYTFEAPQQTGMNEGEKLEFLLDGLGTNMAYYYSVAHKPSEGETWTWREERRFQTVRDPGTSFRFCVLTDPHYAWAPPLHPYKVRVSENVEADVPDFVVTLGDMNPISNQGAGEPLDCDRAFAFFPIEDQVDADDSFEHCTNSYLDIFAHSSMLTWVNGNHEGLAGHLSGCPQYPYVMNARKRYIPLLDHDDPDAFFGDFVWGDVHVIWIDPLAFSTYDPLNWNDPTGYALGDVQRDWLTATLAASTSRWKLIFAHSLFGGAGPNFECNPGSAYARGNANFVDSPGTDQILIQSLMEQYDVNAYVYGHDHLYSVSDYNGVKYVLAGVGVQSPWGDCLSRYYLPWTTINEWGHLRVDVEPDGLMLSYVRAALDDSNGEIMDVQIID